MIQRTDIFDGVANRKKTVSHVLRTAFGWWGGAGGTGVDVHHEVQKGSTRNTAFTWWVSLKWVMKSLLRVFSKIVINSNLKKKCHSRNISWCEFIFSKRDFPSGKGNGIFFRPVNKTRYSFRRRNDRVGQCLGSIIRHSNKRFNFKSIERIIVITETHLDARM